MEQDSPFRFTGEASAKYEHGSMTKHLIIEYRDDELKVCHPKIKPNKDHWYSKQKLWSIHLKPNGEIDIRLVNE